MKLGKCISEPKKEDLLYLDDKTNTYKKCPEGTEKIENNICIIRKEDKIEKSSNITIIIILTIIILIIIISFFFMKRYISRKKFESEMSISFLKYKD